MRILSFALLLAGCATTSPETAAPPPPPSACNGDAAATLVGRAADSQLGAEALRLSGAHELRWLRPGDMATMDYNPERLNVHLDAEGKVARLACG